MKSIVELLHWGSRIFPGLALWLRFPGLICWVSVSSGIIMATLFPVGISKAAVTISQFYTIKLISSILSFSVALFFPSRIVRFTAFFLLAFLLYTLRTSEQHGINELLEKNQDAVESHIAYGNIISTPVPVKQGYRFFLKCDEISFDPQGILKRKLIQCTGAVSPVTCARVAVFGRCSAPAVAKRPHEFDESRFLLSKNIRAKMEVDSIKIISPPPVISKMSGWFRERVLAVLDRLHNPVHKGILQATFLGEAGYLAGEIKESFRKSGIYHLLSISGLHASMLIAATYLFLSLVPVRSNVKHIIAICVLWAYQFFIGFIPSLFRATIMATLVVGSFLYQKKNYSLHSIGLAGTFWLLHSPESLFLPGFQLSFTATIGIITLAPVFNRLCPKTPSPATDFILSRTVSLFNISFSGFLTTLPVLAWHFGSVSLFGLISNLAAASLMTLCMWSFFSSLLFESFINPAAAVAIGFSAFSLDLLIYISRLADLFRWSSVTVDAFPPETVSCYALFLAGLIAISKKHTVTYLKWGLPVLILLFPVISILKTQNNEICIDRFSSKRCSALAVCWPHRGVWILCNGNVDELGGLFNFSISTWMRHRRNVYLEKVIVFHNNHPNKVMEIAPGFLLNNTGTLSKASSACSPVLPGRLPVKPLIKTDSTICLLIRPNCSYPGKNFRIETKKQWISFNFKDSTIACGAHDTPGYQVCTFPLTLNLNTATAMSVP